MTMRDDVRDDQPLLDVPAERVIQELCEEIDRLREHLAKIRRALKVSPDTPDHSLFVLVTAAVESYRLAEASRKRLETELVAAKALADKRAPREEYEELQERLDETLNKLAEAEGDKP
jgi:hypothetical protein